MKVVILGFGAVGSVLAKLLAKEEQVEKIICGDIKFSFKVHHKKITLKYLNFLEKSKFLKFLKKVKPDVVVNAALPKFNLEIMEACLKARVNYLDMASYWDIDKNPKAKVPYKMEQLDFDKSFEEADIMGLIESGVAPGLDNLLAAECASKLDEVDYIKIRMVEDTGSKEVFFSWNKDWLLDELATKPLVYYDKKFKVVEPFTDEEEYEFPKPIGKKKVALFCQDEVGSIPFYIKTKNIDVKIHDNNINVSRFLVELGLASNKKIKVREFEISPVEVLSAVLPDSPPGSERKFPNSIFAISVEALGKIKGKNKKIKYSVVFPRQREIEKMGLGANFISYPTALSAKLFVMAIPKITKKGVFPPEALDKEIRKEILQELEKTNKTNVKIFKS